MIVMIVMCLAITASGLPVSPGPEQQGPDLLHQTAPVETPKAGPQVLVQIHPGLEQQHPPPGTAAQLPVPQMVPQPLPPFLLQHQPWFHQGGVPLMLPFQPSLQGAPLPSLPTQHQQPLMLPPYGYFPVVSSPQGNQQQYSPYTFPMVFQGAPLPNPGFPVPNTPTIPVQAAGETTPGPVAPATAPQPKEQKPNPQILYMFHQPTTSQLGGLSSEELEMAAKMGQMGFFLPSLQPNVLPEARPVSPEIRTSGPASASANPSPPVFNLPPLPSSPGLLRLSTGMAGAVWSIPGPGPETKDVPVGLDIPGTNQNAGLVQNHHPVASAPPPPQIRAKAFPEPAVTIQESNNTIKP